MPETVLPLSVPVREVILVMEKIALVSRLSN